MKHLLEELLDFLAENVWDIGWESVKERTRDIGALICGVLTLLWFYSGFVEWHLWNEQGVSIFLEPAFCIALTFGLFCGGWWFFFERRVLRRRNKAAIRPKRAQHGFLTEAAELGSAMALIYGSWLIPWFGLLAVREDVWFALRVAVVYIGFSTAFFLLLLWIPTYAPWPVQVIAICSFLAIGVWYPDYGPKDPFGISVRLDKYKPHVFPRTSNGTTDR